MIYKMTPHEFFVKVIELYQNARKPKFYNPNIHRGRSSSISSDVEDLTALFIALNNPNDCQYYTDQPMKFENSNNKYPDIVIQHSNGSIDDLIDVKTDIGWNRDGMFEFCKEWDNRIEEIKDTKTSFKMGTNKEIKEGRFSTNLHYHVVVLSKINSGKKIESDYIEVLNNLRNVSLYLLSTGIHPNNYDSEIDITREIRIDINEFDRLFNKLIK